MIKYFCDLCGKEIHGTDVEDAERIKYKASVPWLIVYGTPDGFAESMADGAAYESVYCVCPGCASVIMDTISKLRVEES